MAIARHQTRAQLEARAPEESSRPPECRAVARRSVRRSPQRRTTILIRTCARCRTAVRSAGRTRAARAPSPVAFRMQRMSTRSCPSEVCTAGRCRQSP